MGSIAPSERSIDGTMFARLSLAAASIAAGLIHATVVPHHLQGSVILGAGFVATAIFQVAWAVPASVRPHARTLDLGVAVNATVVAAWITSRTIGLPFGPHAWMSEPVGAADATATVLELLIVIGATLVRVSQPDQGSKPASEARGEKARSPMRDRPLTSSRVAEHQPGDGSLPDPIAVLFDVDGTLISTGGAGTRSWRWAFEELHGIPADIGEHSEAGMTDPVVGSSTFRNVLHRDPTEGEMRSLLAAYLERLPTEVQASEGYRVFPGAEEVLRFLHGTGRVTGIVTGALEDAARIKLARADLNRFLPFGGFGSDSADRTELTRRAIERGAVLVHRELPPKRVHVLGDTPLDMDAAVAVGAVPIGITTGTYPADALSLAGAKVVIATLEAYPVLLQ